MHSHYRPEGSYLSLPENLEYPIAIKSIRFSKLTSKVKNDFLCFDHIGVFQKTPLEITDSAKQKNPFPLTEDGIMPIGMAEGAKNSVRQAGTGYVFEYQHGLSPFQIET